MRAPALVLTALLSLGLSGCNRTVEGNPNAPGGPGTGNPREVGSSGGDAAPSTSGRGTADADASRTPQPGAGLAGGLAGGMGGSSGVGMTGTFPSGTTTQSAAAGAATAGSPNRTPRSGVGTR